MANDVTTIRNAEVTAGSFRTHYYTAGKADAPPVVLLHDGAWGADALITWEPVIEDLAADHSVIAPDLLGFGHTDKAVFLDRSPYSYRVRHIADFCRAIGLQRPAHFVGTSFGGSLALRGAADGEWPMASVTSFGGTGGPWRTEAGKKVLAELEPGRAYLETVVGMLTNDPAGHPHNVDRRAENVVRAGHYAAMVSPHLRHPEQPPQPPTTDYPASLSQATVPVHVAEMSDDKIIEPGWTEQLRSVVPGVHVHHIHGPHSPNLTQPAEVSALLRDIVASSHT